MFYISFNLKSKLFLHYLYKLKLFLRFWIIIELLYINSILISLNNCMLTEHITNYFKLDVKKLSAKQNMSQR